MPKYIFALSSAVALAFAALPTAGTSSTVELLALAKVTQGDDALSSDPFTKTDSFSGPSTSTSIDGRVSGFLPSSEFESLPGLISPGWRNEADYFASVNAATGELRFSLNGSFSSFCEGNLVTPCGSGSYDARAFTSVSETFTVSGTGTLRSVMQVDALWSSPNYNFVADLSLFGGASVFDTDSVNFATGGLGVSTNGSEDGTNVDRLISAEIEIFDATDLVIDASWRMFGGISAIGVDDGLSVNGFLNASNTGTFFVFASDGLTFAPSNTAFLSNPAFLDAPAPIPVPAALALLLTALAGLGGIASRRRFAEPSRVSGFQSGTDTSTLPAD